MARSEQGCKDWLRARLERAGDVERLRSMIRRERSGRGLDDFEERCLADLLAERAAASGAEADSRIVTPATRDLTRPSALRPTGSREARSRQAPLV
jgi:hypothetical protein